MLNVEYFQRDVITVLKTRSTASGREPKECNKDLK